MKTGEGESVWSLGGRFTVKVADADSEGRFALVEALALRTTEPPLHFHHNEDEAWYVLDGKMTWEEARTALLQHGTRLRRLRPAGGRPARERGVPGPRRGAAEHLSGLARCLERWPR